MDPQKTELKTEVKAEQKLSSWPSPQDYNEAVQDLRLNAIDAELRKGVVEVNALGLPMPRTGAFASVYKVKVGRKSQAIRCFLRDLSDQQKRYAHISEFVRGDSLPYTVDFDFVQKGIRVNGRWYPLLRMDWVEGENLDSYVEQHLGTPRMAALADAFKKMCNELRAAGIAHGDLQHGNIILCNHELRLVDYDGMYVPAMKGFRSNEIGHRNYQHPGRVASHFGPDLDNFSAWVIYASLRMLALDKDLWRLLGAGDDCLLFRRDDFLQPEHSYTFALLERHPNEEIRRLARFLRWQAGSQPEDVPPLTDKVPETPELLPIKLLTATIKPPPAVSANIAVNRKSALPDWMDAVELTAAIGRGQGVSTRGGQGYLQSGYSQSGHLQTGYPGNLQTGHPGAYLPAGFEPELYEAIPRFVAPNESNRLNPILLQSLMIFNPLVWVMFAYMFAPNQQATVAVCFVLNLILELLIWVPASNQKNLVQNGMPAVAHILEGKATRNSEGNMVYVVTYGFDVLGKSYKRKIHVSYNEYMRLAQVKTETVLYNPANPNSNELYSRCRYRAVETVRNTPATMAIEYELREPAPRPVAFNEVYTAPANMQIAALCSPTFWMIFAVPSFILGPILLVLNLVIAYMIWAKPFRDWSLAREGLAVQGKVTSTFLEGDSESHQKCIVEYEFPVARGQVKRIRRRISSDEFKKLHAPERLTILYDPANPDKNVIYKFSRYHARIP